MDVVNDHRNSSEAITGIPQVWAVICEA